MEINLFRCTAENERVDKTSFITSRFVMNGTLRSESSIINPVITIEKSNPAIQHYNYMYIPEFKRWYYINDIVSVRNNLWEIHAHVDVLYTWGADIKSMYGVADKLEDITNANVYFDDGSFIMDSRNDIEVKEFPNGLNENGSYILICAGGV